MTKHPISIILAALGLGLLCLAGCREVDIVVPSETDQPTAADTITQVAGMYLLNEGNMGSNKCTIDYMDFTTGTYSRNIYSERNPNVPMQLGDVGNDIEVYGSRLWAVINCSNKVEVLDAATAVRIGQVNIPNCRNVAFHGGYAYVTSYVGPVSLNPDNAVPGRVYKVDTLSLEIVAECQVGYQPDELAIAGGKIYVANSGGYLAPDYDNTVSVVDLATFTQERQITVGKNPSLVRCDNHGQIWVTTRGDYIVEPGRTFVLAPDKQGDYQVAQTIDVPMSNMAIHGDSLYYCSTQWSYATQGNVVTYGIINTATRQQVSDQFITDGTQAGITIPYGIAVNPASGDIYVADAKNYVSSGTLHCYSPQGVLQWSVTTGDIPAHMCFWLKKTAVQAQSTATKIHP